jgi:DNA-binding LacI/PurR family transcriptional regulator
MSDVTTDQARRSGRVTTADIARVVGVSRATVGFVLNDTPGQTISESTRNRVLEAARRMDYRPNNAARALASGRTHVVLLVLPDWPLEAGTLDLIEAASRRLEDAGYALVTHTPHRTSAGRPLWESLHPDVVIGLGLFNLDQVRSMRAAGVQHIVPDPDTPIDLSEIPGYSQGTLLQVEHLLSLGHQRLAFAGSPDPRLRTLMSLRVSAAQQHAGKLGAALVDVRNLSVGDGSADTAVRAWLNEGVTAALAYNDQSAALVAGAVLRAGLSMPADLAVIGHDDGPLSALFVPSISSVSQDTSSAGRLLADAALAAAEGIPMPPLEIDMCSVLKPRETTVGADRTG